jgi:small subunit ribosomal protein S7
VPKDKGMTMAIRWIKDFSLKKKGKPMKVKLAEEIVSAYKKEGSVIKKRDDTHKMAEANRAFAHFRY